MLALHAFLLITTSSWVLVCGASSSALGEPGEATVVAGGAQSGGGASESVRVALVSPLTSSSEKTINGREANLLDGQKILLRATHKCPIECSCQLDDEGLVEVLCLRGNSPINHFLSLGRVFLGFVTSTGRWVDGGSGGGLIRWR